MSLCAFDPPLMFSKVSFPISFSQPLRSHEHRTLSTVSFSFACDANHHAFPLMSPEEGLWGHVHTHSHSLSLSLSLSQTLTDMHANVHACPYKQQIGRHDSPPTHTHAHKHKHTHMHTHTYTHTPTRTYTAVPSNYERGEPLISWSVASASHHSVFVSPLLFPCGRTQLFSRFPRGSLT